MEEKNQVDIERYSRNILVPEIGIDGQKAIDAAKVLVIGAGGLGSALIYYLAAAGVGTIGIVDNDFVEISNLQRQIIHNNNDVGYAKTDSAYNKIIALNPNVIVHKYCQRVSGNETDLFKKYEIIADATDNFQSRFRIADLAHKTQRPLIFAAVQGWCGQISLFEPFLQNSPCYRCFNPHQPGDDFVIPMEKKGIIGAVAGTFGAMMANEVIKRILQLSTLRGKIMTANFLNNHFTLADLHKNPQCEHLY